MKDSFKGQIVGTVERIRPYSKGQVVTVVVKANPNAQFGDKVTVWCVGSAPVSEGQRVSVTGQVSWKVEEYNGKWYARTSLNFPQWGELEAVVAEGKQPDTWAAGGVLPDDGVPF